MLYDCPTVLSCKQEAQATHVPIDENQRIALSSGFDWIYVTINNNKQY